MLLLLLLILFLIVVFILLILLPDWRWTGCLPDADAYHPQPPRPQAGTVYVTCLGTSVHTGTVTCRSTRWGTMTVTWRAAVS